MTKQRKTMRVLAMAAVAAMAGQLHAANLTWNPNQTQPATGGTGIWNTSSNFWTADDGATHTTWTNATPDNAIIGVWPGSNGGAGGTLTLSEAITAGTMSFNADNYTINLAGNNLAANGALSFFTTGLVGVNANTIAITDTSAPGGAGVYTIGSTSGYGGIRLTGNLNVTYNNSSIITLSGANDFTGTLRILQGTVRADQTNLGSANGLIRLEGTGQMNFTAAGNKYYNTFTRNLELNGTTARVTVNSDRDITLTGTISGTGDFNNSLTQGMLVLAGNNTYSGATIQSGAGGTIVLANDHALGLSPAISSPAASSIGITGGVHIGQNANLVTPTLTMSGAQPVNGYGHLVSLGGDNTFDGNITPGSNIARVYGVVAGSSLTLNGIIDGDATAASGTGVLKVGDGTLVLTGASDYGQRNATTGNETEIRGGTLRLDFNGPASPLVDIVNNNNATNGNQVTYPVMAGGTLELKGKAGVVNSQRFKNSSATNSFTIRPGESAIKLNQNGATSLTLNTGRWMEANRQVGGTIDLTLPTNGGVIMGTAATGSIGVANQILLANSAAFATVNGTDWASMDASRNVISGANVTGFYTANTATTVSGNADVVGSDTTLAGADATTISLRFNEAAARTIDATGQTLTTAGILVTANVGNNVASISGGTLRGTDATATTLQDLVIIQNNTSNKLTISSNITNTNNAAATGLTKSGAGTLELSGTNTYTGVTHVNKGVLKLASPGALPGGVDATVGAGESGLTIKGGVVGLTSDFSRQLTTGGTIGVTTAAAGQIRWNDSGGFAAYGATRTVAIPNSDVDPTLRTLFWGGTGSSSTTIGFVPSTCSLILGAADADGTIVLSNPIALGNGNIQAWNVQRTIEVRDGSAAVDAKLSGVISTEFGVEKTGAGTLELSATNTYLGGTTVKGGTLLVTGTIGASNGEGVTVNSGGTLQVGNGGASGVVNNGLTNNGAVVFNRSDNVSFAGTITGGGSVANAGAGTTTLTANNTYAGATIATGGKLALAKSLTSSASVSASNNGIVELSSNGTFNKAIKTGGVSASTGGRINIDDNKLIVTAQGVGTWNGTAYTDVTGLIASGYSPNQDFSGSGIVTTQSNATGGNTLSSIGVASNTDLGLATFGGVSVGANDTLVMYTYGGDANLDGIINGDDYFQVDSAFPTGGHGWFNGDFNYDGVVNGDDYFIIDSNFPAQGAAIPTSGGVASLAGVTAVPEPASIAVIVMGAGAAVARRRRRS